MNDVVRSYEQDPENHPARNIGVEGTGALLDRLTEGEKKAYADMFLKRLERLEEEMAEKRKGQPEETQKPATTPISLRVPNDVLERWKATGPGWQTRMVQRLSAP